MTIQLTETAASHIRKAIVEKRGGVALRLGVKKVGCSGFAYTFDVAQELAPTDHLFEAYEAKLVVAEDSLRFLDGSTVDFVRQGFKETFHIDNPNIKTTCGCGESFGV